MAEYNAKNGAALARLVNENGVKLEKFNDKVYDAFAKVHKKFMMKFNSTVILLLELTKLSLKLEKKLELGRTCQTHHTLVKETEH